MPGVRGEGSLVVLTEEGSLVVLAEEERERCRNDVKRSLALCTQEGRHSLAVAFGGDVSCAERGLTLFAEEAFLSEKRKGALRAALPRGVVWEMDVKEAFPEGVRLGRVAGLRVAAEMEGLELVALLKKWRVCQKELQAWEGASDVALFLRGRVAGMSEGERLIRAGNRDQILVRLVCISEASVAHIESIFVR